MSDIEWLKLFADGLSGDDPGHEEVHWAAAEIERLRERAEHDERRILADGRVIDSLKQRIEELDTENDRLLTALNGYEHWSKGEGYIITDAQIDAAWAIAMKDKSDFGSKAVLYALKELGIERCEGCDDSLKPGTVFKMDMGERGYITDCPDCDGHGWGSEAAMTDKVRRVSTFYPIEDPWDRTDRIMMKFDPSGTHALVPIEVWERAIELLTRLKERRAGDCEVFVLDDAVEFLEEVGGGDE